MDGTKMSTVGEGAYRISWRKKVSGYGGGRRERAVLTARSNPPNLCSKTGQMAISYSLVCPLNINNHNHNDTPFSSSASFH